MPNDKPQTTLKERKWEPQFVRTVIGPDNSKVDMYIVRDDPNGTYMVTIGVPHKDIFTPTLICDAMNERNRR